MGTDKNWLWTSSQPWHRPPHQPLKATLKLVLQDIEDDPCHWIFWGELWAQATARNCFSQEREVNPKLYLGFLGLTLFKIHRWTMWSGKKAAALRRKSVILSLDTPVAEERGNCEIMKEKLVRDLTQAFQIHHKKVF